MRDAAFCVSPMQKGFLLREGRWAYIEYGEGGGNGVELFDMEKDPKQYANLAAMPEHAAVVAGLRAKMAAKMKALRTNDLGA